MAHDDSYGRPLSRRQVLKGGLGLALGASALAIAGCGSSSGSSGGGATGPAPKPKVKPVADGNVNWLTWAEYIPPAVVRLLREGIQSQGHAELHDRRRAVRPKARGWRALRPDHDQQRVPPAEHRREPAADVRSGRSQDTSTRRSSSTASHFTTMASTVSPSRTATVRPVSCIAPTR